MAHSNLKGKPRIPTAKPKGFLTVREAMRRCGCSEITLRRWIARRIVSVVRWRERVLIRAEDLAHRDRVRKYRRKRRAAKAPALPGTVTEPAGGPDTTSETTPSQPGAIAGAQLEAPASAEVSS